MAQQEHKGPLGKTGSWIRPWPAFAYCGPALVLAPWAFSPGSQSALGFLELFALEAHLLLMAGSASLQFFAHVFSYLLGNVNLTQGVHGSTHTGFSFISKQ